jgi:hypothetical protein
MILMNEKRGKSQKKEQLAQSLPIGDKVHKVTD